MKTVRIPAWLQTVLEANGVEMGAFTFGSSHQDAVEQVEITGLPDEFVGIARDEAGGGLAVAKKQDGVIYRFEDKTVDVFAMDEAEFAMAIRRDETWEELSENMPVSQGYYLGIVLKTKTQDGKLLTLGFKGGARDSAMVIRGRAEAEEMIADSLERELAEALEIEDFEILDLVDDGGVVEEGMVQEPLFTVVVQVPHFEPGEKIPDVTLDWIDMETKKTVN